MTMISSCVCLRFILKKRNDCLNITESNRKILLPGPLGQSDSPFDWFSGGRGFDPLSGHIMQ